MTIHRSSPSPDDSSGRPSPLFVAFGVGGAPAAWGMHLALSYYVVPRACATGTTLWLHLVTLGTAAVAVAATVAAVRLRGRAGDGRGGEERDEVLHALGTVGVLVGVLFVAATLVEGVPVLFIDPCQ